MERAWPTRCCFDVRSARDASPGALLNRRGDERGLQGAAGVESPPGRAPRRQKIGHVADGRIGHLADTSWRVVWYTEGALWVKGDVISLSGGHR